MDYERTPWVSGARILGQKRVFGGYEKCIGGNKGAHGLPENTMTQQASHTASFLTFSKMERFFARL